MRYKRNQLEEAIARVLDLNSQEPPSELRTRIKRLLDLDRSLGRKLRSRDAEEANFAFFSEEAPGSGANISFSEYEVFAVLSGLVVMEHGWPQSFAVSLMRRLRPDLEREHARILRQDPEKLFDLEQIRAKAQPGDIFVDNSDPVFVTVVSKVYRAPQESSSIPACAVCRGFNAAMRFSREVGGASTTMLEIATRAHKLRQQLAQTEPRRRGRGES